MKPALFVLVISTSSVLAAPVNICNEASLRSALNEGGTVNLTCNGVITISNTLVIATNVALVGDGYDVIISGNGAVTVFQVNPGVELKIQHVVIADGRGMAGGALYNDRGTVHLEDCVLQDNQADGTNRTTGLPGLTTQGGAIYNMEGTISLLRSSLLRNRVKGLRTVSGQPAMGGAVYSMGGVVAATNVSFVGNQAIGGDGSLSLFVTTPGGPGRGGGIYSEQTIIHLSGSVFSNNLAAGGAGGTSPHALTAGAGGTASGGAVRSEGGTLLISHSVFLGNAATGGSGGRAASGGAASGGALASVLGQTTIRSSEFWWNSVVPGWGRPETASNPNGDGGAIFNSGSLTVFQTTFATNATSGSLASDRPSGPAGGAGQGGAIYNSGTNHLVACSFFGNRASGGGGVVGEGFGGAFHAPGPGTGRAVYNVNQLTIEQSTLAGNTALGGSGAGLSMACFCTGSGGLGLGGAVFSGGTFSAGTLRLTNSTLTANLAMGGAAGLTPGFGTRGIGGSASGGGLYATSSSEVHFVTLAGNSAIGGEGSSLGSGTGGNISAFSGTLFLRASILAYGIGGTQCAGNIIDNGYNLASDNGCTLSGTGSMINVDPRLGPLADNGGATLTMELLNTSPAIDAVGQDCIAVDQRGQPRPGLAWCDIGAYEKQGSFLIQSVERMGNQVLLRGLGIPSSPFRFQASVDLASWETAASGIVETDGSFEVVSSVVDRPQTFYRIVSP